MKKSDVKALASMPLQSPTYPRGPYRFFNRQYMAITYRTDPAMIRAHLPEPLEPEGDTVVVLGPGPIGLLCARMAALSGANPLMVVGLTADAARLETARRLGATHTVDALVDDLLEGKWYPV